MRVIADLHIHSRFSRATSKRITPSEIGRFAKIKGLDVVGTGDFTHPKWLAEMRECTTEINETGLFKLADGPVSPRFMLTSEVCTVTDPVGASKQIHHVILAKGFEEATQINERLSNYGDLTLDGRPLLQMSSPHLVEEVMTVSKDSELIPAHVWTPWFSLFGDRSGYDRIEDCYHEMTRHIHALETGLSSDPPMNWRLSELDQFTLVSNSDCHSCWPWRIGREANVFELPEISYRGILDVIRKKDPTRFKYTIETNPAYGKYHWTGHRNCGVRLPPAEAVKMKTQCPVCRRKMTKGVGQRIEELSDRPRGFKPPLASGFIHLLPLSEIIASVLNASSPAVQSVWSAYNRLVSYFGSEYAVLIDAPPEDLGNVTETGIADAILKVRAGRAYVTPGYDGVYGELNLHKEKVDEEEPPRDEDMKTPQRNMTEWCSNL
jgi:uncharacterized protein (TIGR00375 family)